MIVIGKRLFVGIKMSVSHWYHLPTPASLAAILLMLVAAVVFSARRNAASRRMASAADGGSQSPTQVAATGRHR